MMDEETRAKLQSILDNWIPESECSHCRAYRHDEKLKTIIARDGTKFFDLIQLDITHNPNCPYAIIAGLLGGESRQFWRIAPELSHDVDLRGQE